MQVFECPGCKRQLIGSVTKCQFCGADVTKTPRPVVQAPQKAKIAAFETPKYVWGLYYALAGWWILGGIFSILQMIDMHRRAAAKPTLLDDGSWGLVDMVLIGFAAISILVGLGLICRLRVIRQAVNILSGLKILFGVLALPGSFLMMSVLGPIGFVGLLSDIIDILTGIGTIWLLSETANNLWDG